MLNSDIKFLPGVGPKRAEVLAKELNVHTFGQLLYYFPFRHEDKSRIYTIRELPGLGENPPVLQLRGRIVGFKTIGGGKQGRLTAIFEDPTGTLELVWFKGQAYVQKSLKLNTPYILFGKPALFNNKFSIVHPEIEDPQHEDNKITSTIQAIYSSTEALKNSHFSNRAISRLMSAALTAAMPHLEETLPPALIAQQQLLGLQEALLNIHFPQSMALLQQAQRRLKLEELFYLQLQLLRRRVKRLNDNNGFLFSSVGSHFHTFYQCLPFALTEAQKRVIKEIRRDMGAGKQMNRLLQGDVGSGKTIVALLCALIAADNGFQSCIMAPTEILATQHYHSMQQSLQGLDFEVELLTGSTKKAKRNQLFARLLEGQINLLIGTHALIEDSVQFQKLGLVVIDEQHRFGVNQRGRLWSKSNHPPHVLVMTATPIPRTLAMTLYGDLDLSAINELPPGRKPIRTLHYTDARRAQVYDFIQQQITLGRQVYVVYPLIQESETMDYKNLQEGYQQVCERFPQLSVSMVHGKMKPQEKEQQMQQFVLGQTQIMVATSVIEVGVNVPNAALMVIESSERFGLAQLHQLRGRVGRGADQSFCILMSGVKLSRESRQRLQMMCQTNDGFKIAEADLQLRGHGDIEGTRQSGLLNLHIANLQDPQDQALLEQARHIAEAILDRDPYLSLPEHQTLLRQLTKHPGMDYSEIS